MDPTMKASLELYVASDNHPDKLQRLHSRIISNLIVESGYETSLTLHHLDSIDPELTFLESYNPNTNNDTTLPFLLRANETSVMGYNGFEEILQGIEDIIGGI